MKCQTCERGARITADSTTEVDVGIAADDILVRSSDLCSGLLLCEVCIEDEMVQGGKKKLESGAFVCLWSHWQNDVKRGRRKAVRD